jgi:hypothetical protein
VLAGGSRTRGEGALGEGATLGEEVHLRRVPTQQRSRTEEGARAEIFPLRRRETLRDQPTREEGGTLGGPLPGSSHQEWSRRSGPSRPGEVATLGG